MKPRRIFPLIASVCASAFAAQPPIDLCGGQISLLNRMFDPCDDEGDKLATFALKIGGENEIAPGAWHTVELAWDTIQSTCAVRVDGKPAHTLRSAQPEPDGLSYLRLRSTAAAVDPAGDPDLADRSRSSPADAAWRCWASALVFFGSVPACIASSRTSRAWFCASAPITAPTCPA